MTEINIKDLTIPTSNGIPVGYLHSLAAELKSGWRRTNPMNCRMEELNPCNHLATSSGFKNKNYIAGSACWQYGINTVFWSATRASMMGTWAWSGLTKFVIFLDNFPMESQKAAEDTWNKEKINDSRGFIMLQHSWLSFLALEINSQVVLVLDFSSQRGLRIKLRWEIKLY